uniref:protein-tyrosine-phosphatase n=1 Tax=Rattus norvegicus TaxID=10116 RepID=A0ABK0LEY7_RAT
MKVTSLDGRRLRKMLRKEAEARCVVLDCRPYLAFAASSVRGSLNVNLNSVVLRRARGGAVSARYVLPDEAARARLLQEGGGGVAAVVVLDQGSRHWQKLREESAARVVLTSLLACLPAGPRVYFLKGGYETFYSQYPECCVDAKPISQEKLEGERGLLSQCGKPILSVAYRPAYDQGGPVEILPFLYLGSAYHASKCEFLANLHITALLNVSRRTSEACTTHLHYKWIPVEDSHTADISSHFQEAIDFIGSCPVAHTGLRPSPLPGPSECEDEGTTTRPNTEEVLSSMPPCFHEGLPISFSLTSVFSETSSHHKTFKLHLKTKYTTYEVRFCGLNSCLRVCTQSIFTH